MKKFLLICLALSMVLCLGACTSSATSSKNKFVALEDDEILVVGSASKPFMNYENEQETIRTLSYTVSVTYTLQRSYHDYGYQNDAVLYNNYYYYWSVDTQSATQELGTETVKKVYQYFYLPYGESENVVVKSVVRTQVSYDYDGGWVEKDVKVNTDLGGYFATFESLKAQCPELAEKIDVNTTRKYYVDTTTPDHVSTDEKFYDSYYYIEEK